MNYLKYSASNDNDDISVEFIGDKNIFVIKTQDGTISFDKKSMRDFYEMISRMNEKTLYLENYQYNQCAPRPL